jgi:hypothetical protein
MPTWKNGETRRKRDFHNGILGVRAAIQEVGKAGCGLHTKKFRNAGAPKIRVDEQALPAALSEGFGQIHRDGGFSFAHQGRGHQHNAGCGA